jgi:hypothetical protein
VGAGGPPRPPRGARRGVERALGTRLDASQQPASVCSRKRYPGTRSGQTRLPYGIALHERRWHGGLRRPRSSLGGQRSPSRPFVSAAINSRGRPRPGGRERRAVAKRVCGAGLRHQTVPPAAQQSVQSPDRVTVAAAGPLRHSSRPCDLPVQSEPQSPSTPRHCGSRCCWVSRPAAAARCEPGVFRRPHTRELLCAPASFGVISHAPQRAEQPAAG